MNSDQRSVKLEEICAQITDGKHGDCQDEDNSGFYFISCKDVLNGKINYEKARQITEADFIDTHRRTRLEASDILITNSGTIGRMAIAPDNDLTRRTTFQKSVAILKPIKSQAEPGFLYYRLQSDIQRLTEYAGGTAQKNLLLRDLRAFPVELPSLPVQRRIAGILSAYDDLIENNLRRIRILEEMARALYREWFVHFRFPGHEKILSVASSLGPVPQGWEVKNLESLMTDHIGGGWGKDALDEGHAEPAWVIRGTDIPDARYCQVTNVPHRYHSVSNLRSRHLQAGDIIFEVSGGSKGQPVGRTLFVSKELLSAFDGDSVICASFCKRVRPDASAYSSELLYLSFLEGYESGEIEQFQVQSTGISNFKWTDYILQTLRVVPPEPLQACFRELVAPLFSQIATLGLKTMNLRRTRDLLLPRLLSGEVSLAIATAKPIENVA